MVLKILDTVIGNGRVELNHYWVQLSPLLTLPLYIPFLCSLLYTPIAIGLPTGHTRTRPYKQPPFDTPSLNFYTFLYSSFHLLSTPPLSSAVTRPPLQMTSPPLTLPLIIPFLYSSLQFFSTSSLLPLSPHLSQDHPPRMTSPPFTLPLYIPFLYFLSICLP